MTKTQLELLTRAAQSPRGIVCVSRGHERKISYGRREQNAIIALRDAGLVTFVSSHTETDHRAVHTQVLWQITDAGRKAIGA